MKSRKHYDKYGGSVHSKNSNSSHRSGIKKDKSVSKKDYWFCAGKPVHMFRTFDHEFQ